MELLDRIIEAQTEEAHAFNVIKSYVITKHNEDIK